MSSASDKAVGRFHPGENMKKFVLAAAIAAMSTSATAGSAEEPVMEAPMIVEQTAASSSAAGVWIPLVLLAIVAAIVVND